MIEIFNDAKIETSADTRAKAVRALGLDEPPVSEKMNRADFGSDEEYFHAMTELSLRNNSPEYRAEYSPLHEIRATPHRSGANTLKSPVEFPHLKCNCHAIHSLF